MARVVEVLGHEIVEGIVLASVEDGRADDQLLGLAVERDRAAHSPDPSRWRMAWWSGAIGSGSGSGRRRRSGVAGSCQSTQHR